MKLEFISPARTLQIEIANIINSIFEISLASSQVLINVCYPKYDAHYTSAIALTIANRLDKNSLAIAEEICLENLKISGQWQIKALGKGWLNIFLSEQYLAESLSALDIWQPDISDIFINSVGESPEATMQYAYARCCALIRLADRSVNFLCTDFLRTDIAWDFIEPAEISLLMQQLAIADLLEDHAHLDRYKLSRSLAEVFLQFYDHCRIFGVTPKIAYRRLLLIRVTQKLLLAIAPLGTNYAIYL